MPIQRCSVKGVEGWQWGKSGKCYPGEGGKAEAVKQGQAVRTSGWAENLSMSVIESLSMSMEDALFAVQNVRRIRTSVVRTNPMKSDPTRTKTLRKRFEQDIGMRFIALRRAVIALIVEEDAFGLNLNRPFNQEQDDDSLLRRADSGLHGRILVRNTVPDGVSNSRESRRKILNQRFAFQSTAEQVVSFEGWIKEQLDDGLIDPGDPYWEKYIRQGYEKGAGRAFNDTYRARRALSGSAEQQAFFDGTREQFLQTAFGQQESIEKVKLLASRTLTDLKGVSGSVATRMGRILTDGLIQGMGPRAIAKLMIDDKSLGIDKRRAQTIARTEIIRAHAEGQLDALEQMGVEEVGVMVEWSTAGDDRVCPLCQPLEGVVLKIKEARGIIPRHPNCRCSFVPANVGEPEGTTRRVNFGEGTQEIGQRRSKTEVERAIKTSVSRERKAGTLKEKLKRSPWRGADRASTIAKFRPKSILDIGVVRVPGVPKKVTPKPVRVVTPKPKAPARITKIPDVPEKISPSFDNLHSRGLNIDLASFGDDLDPAMMKQFASILDQYDKDFPGILDHILITAEELGPDVGGVFRKEFGQQTFVFSKNVLKNPSTARKLVKSAKRSRWLASDELNSLIEHELGHLVDFRPSSKTGVVPTRFAKSYLRKNPPTRKTLSGYAETSKEEAWAEAWARIRSPGTKPLTSWEKGFRDALIRGYTEKKQDVPVWLSLKKISPKPKT